jgi:hypothetical protein
MWQDTIIYKSLFDHVCLRHTSVPGHFFGTFLELIHGGLCLAQTPAEMGYMCRKTWYPGWCDLGYSLDIGGL